MIDPRVHIGRGGFQTHPLIALMRWLVVVFALGCSIPIQHGLDETAANEILTSLERVGIEASKNRDENGVFAIVVAKGDALRAMELMRSLGLPRGPRAGFGEIYKQPSLVPSPTEERARYVEALAGEIARSLEIVEGVVGARVHLVLPEPDPLAVDGKPRVAAQAAVLLKTRAGRPVPIGEGDVQKLVAGSVPGLDPLAVAVVVTLAPDVAPASDANLVALGPLRMTPNSRRILLVGTAAICALVLLLACFVIVLARRLAAAQRKN
jgi:type III secretion protein J